MLEIVRVLDAEHLQPVALALREPTLDDVFLSLTGHAAEEDGSDGDGDGAAARREDERRDDRAHGEQHARTRPAVAARARRRSPTR